MSVAEQRYKEVPAVIADGRMVIEVARNWGVSRQTMHTWLARYEYEGLQGLSSRSYCAVKRLNSGRLTTEIRRIRVAIISSLVMVRRTIHGQTHDSLQPT